METDRDRITGVQDRTEIRDRIEEMGSHRAARTEIRPEELLQQQILTDH